MTEIYLNIYDLQPQLNYYFHSIGIGLYHTGIQIGDYTEWSFGYHEGTSTGVQSQTPKLAPEGVIFRESLLLGKTSKSKHQLDRILDKLKDEFIGNSYDLVGRNCNSFSNAYCMEVFGKPIPSYINRIACIGNYLRCCIPSSILNNNGGDPMNQQQQSSSSGMQLNNQAPVNKAYSVFQGKGTAIGGGTGKNPYKQIGDDSL